MSDPVIKGVKRTTSRPAPHASSKSSAKGRKLTAESAKPKPKRAAEKLPVRKAVPAKSAASSKSAKTTKRPSAKTKSAKNIVKKARAAAPAKAKSPAKRVVAKPQPRKPTPLKTAKAQPIKAAQAKTVSRHTPTPPRQPSRDEAAALKSFERAHKEFARGHFGTARDLFRALIDQHAGVSEVTARARIYLTIAETRLRSEAALPRDPDSLYDRGVIELNRGDFVSAQELFERALKRDPDAADTHYALAASRARLGSVEAALQSLERAIELKPVLRARAQTDTDLVALRNDPEFERIVFSTPRA